MKTPKEVAETIIAHPDFDAFLDRNLKDDTSVNACIDDWEDCGVNWLNSWEVMLAMKELNPCIFPEGGSFFMVFRTIEDKNAYEEMIFEPVASDLLQ